jgi:hypothetical protein
MVRPLTALAAGLGFASLGWAVAASSRSFPKSPNASPPVVVQRASNVETKAEPVPERSAGVTPAFDPTASSRVRAVPAPLGRSTGETRIASRRSAPAPSGVSAPSAEEAATPPVGNKLVAHGEQLLAEGRVREACAAGHAAAVSAPSSASVWDFLGRCYMRRGDPDRAREHYRRSLAIAPNGPNAVFVRAILSTKGP